MKLRDLIRSLFIAAMLGACVPATQAPASNSERQTPAVASTIAAAADPSSSAPLPISCTMPGLHRGATLAEAEQHFGRENVEIGEQEGSIVETIIYPRDSARRLEVMFDNNQAHQTVVSSVSNRGSMGWTLDGQLKIGDSLEAVERYAGGPFRIDESGDAYLATADEKCNLFIRFEPSLVGQANLQSNDPAVRAQNARVHGFSMVMMNEY